LEGLLAVDGLGQLGQLGLASLRGRLIE